MNLRNFALASFFVLFVPTAARAADTWTTDINAAALYDAQGNRTSAVTLLKDAQKAANSPYEQYESSRLLGALYFDKGDYDNAELQLNACLAFSRQCPFVNARETADALYSITIKRGRNTEALKLHKLCDQLKRVEEAHDPLLQTYGEQLFKRIAEKLYLSPDAVATGKQQTAVCRWVMSRAGRPVFVHLVKSSGIVGFDEVVSTNVQNYLPPLAMPPGAYDFEEFELTFPQIPQGARPR